MGHNIKSFNEHYAERVIEGKSFLGSRIINYGGYMKFSLWLENREGLYDYKGKTIKTWGKKLLKAAIKHMGDFRYENRDKLMRHLDVLMKELPRHPKQMSKDRISKDEFSIIVMDYLGNHDRFHDPVNKLLKVI